MTQPKSVRMVAITQPYVPEYRVPLWERVISNLEHEGVESHVFYGGDPEQLAIRARRGDGVEPVWATRVRTRTWQPIPNGPKLLFRSLPRKWRKRDVLLVTEMQALNLNGWVSLMLRRPYLTLGHGSSETTDQNVIADRLENVLNRGARHVLTYTEHGRQYVIRKGHVRETNVTAFRNSTDTTRLQAAISAVSHDSIENFRRKNGIPDSAISALYLGALNSHKQIDLLVGAARVVFEQSPDHWLVVAGDGEEAWKIKQLANDSGRVVILGQAAAEEFAPAAVMSTLLLNPGRVGLVAVDALVMGLPILTSSAGAHAPEYEYLRPGVDVFETSPTASEFAEAWIGWSAIQPDAPGDIPSVEVAADIISGVILRELGTKK
jgi:glycosyltransferase involved in cell wall biosynthesis